MPNAEMTSFEAEFEVTVPVENEAFDSINVYACGRANFKEAGPYTGSDAEVDLWFDCYAMNWQTESYDFGSPLPELPVWPGSPNCSGP